MSDKYYIEKNCVHFPTHTIPFQYSVLQSIEIGDMLIIRIGEYDKVINYEQNVFGLSISEEKIKWQIEKRKYPKGGWVVRMKCPFVGIGFDEDGLKLTNWCSTTLIVDPVTGEVLKDEYIK